VNLGSRPSATTARAAAVPDYRCSLGTLRVRRPYSTLACAVMCGKSA
jgi:hypothetical protein